MTARWALVAVLIVLAVFAPPFTQNFAGITNQIWTYIVISFLLANALWQHISLKAACIVAACIACVLAGALGVWGVWQNANLGQGYLLANWGFGVMGAIVGALLAHPLLQRIEAFISRKR